MSYVALEQNLCLVCGRPHDTGAILLDRRLRKDTFKDQHAITGMGGLCPECKALHEQGYIALVAASRPAYGETLRPEEAVRTGDIVHLRREAWDKLFNTPLPLGEDGLPRPMVFIDPALAQRLKQIEQGLGQQAPVEEQGLGQQAPVEEQGLGVQS